MLFPPLCAGCDGRVETEFGLCGSCWSQVPLIMGPVCNACGVPVLSESSDGSELCEDCASIPRPWSAGRAAMFYRDMGRTLVLRLKHADRQDIARSTLPWMARVASDLICDDSVFVPVPLHWSRLIKRRYNQAALLAQRLAMHFEKRAVLDGLLRTTATKPLDGVSAQDRFARLDGVIVPNPKRAAKLEGRSVILVDDVMTSGATLTTATNACHAAGASRVDILVLARVAKDD